MKKTNYICDRCKKESVESSFLHNVEIFVDRKPYMSCNYATHYTEWCEKCMIESGMVTWKRKEIENPTVPPTIEQLLLEALRTFIQEEQNG
jgi:hypothetical protein